MDPSLSASAAHGSADDLEVRFLRYTGTDFGLSMFTIGTIEAFVSDLHTSDAVKVQLVRNALIAAGRVRDARPEGLAAARTGTLVPAPIAKHYETSAWKGDVPGSCGIECACGVTYDGFDSLAEAKRQLDRHIADPTGKDGRPAEPAPEPYLGWDGPCAALLHIPTPGETCGVCSAEGVRSAQHVEAGASAGDTCSAECACGMVVSGFDSLAEAQEALARHIADPTGQDYGRADTAEADDPTPVSPARVPLHTGEMTDGGLVEDERCEVCGESLREIALGTLGHIPGEACAPAEDS